MKKFKFKPLTSENIYFLQPHNLVCLGRHYEEAEIAKLCGVSVNAIYRKLKQARKIFVENKAKKCG